LKADAWADLVLSGKIGYLALLRNLRNLAGADKAVLDAGLKILTDSKRIHKELIFPFQFAVAIQELMPVSAKIAKALSQALDISLENMPDLGENVLIAIDHSGSMSSHAVNEHLTNQEVGDIFAASLFKKGCGDVVIFGDSAGSPQYPINPADSVMTIAQGIGRSNYGHGTNFHAIFEYAERTGKVYDTVVIFSDMQAWMTGSRRYGGYGQMNPTNIPKNTVNADIFAFDLAGYGTSQFAQTDPKHHQLSGFSDKSIALLGELKRDPQVLINTIKAIRF
jgi:60 kDa SS-A/Ro ribonucleoprotein